MLSIIHFFLSLVGGEVLLCPQRIPEYCVYTSDSANYKNLYKVLNGKVWEPYTDALVGFPSFSLYFLEKGRIKRRYVLDQNVAINSKEALVASGMFESLRLVDDWKDAIIADEDIRGKKTWALRLDELEIKRPLGCADGNGAIRVTLTERRTREAVIHKLLLSKDSHSFFANVLDMNKPYAFVDRLYPDACSKDSCVVRVGVVSTSSAIWGTIPGLNGRVNLSRLDRNLFAEWSDPCYSPMLLYLPYTASLIFDSSGRYFALGKDTESSEKSLISTVKSFRHLLLNLKVRQWYKGSMKAVSENLCKHKALNCTSNSCEICVSSVFDPKVSAYTQPSAFLQIHWSFSDSIIRSKSPFTIKKRVVEQ